jgi:sugar transferase EpsL
MIKRLFDLLIASIALLVLSPVIIAAALAIFFRLGEPIFFRQARPGLGGKPFELIKFRTMSNDIDENGNLLPDDQRQVPLGRFLRASSVDELPGLLCVLKGEMSLVGPRPLLMEYLELYTVEQLRRHTMKPGITGLAQVNGRNAISWEEKFELDLWYIDHWSFWLDVKILWMTVFKVAKRTGISAAGESTMPKFTGSNH